MGAGIRIEAVSGRRGLRRFLDVPKRLFGPETPWVAPLDWEQRRFFDPRHNSFLERGTIDLLVAVDAAGRDVGRVGAVDNPAYNEFHGTRTGFFGFFDTPDDPQVAGALLEAAAARAAARGHAVLHGPVSPSTNHQCGLLVDGFDDPPAVMMPWNPPFYEPLLTAAGLAPVKELVAVEYDCADGVPEHMRRVERVLERRRGFTTRKLELRRIGPELERFMAVYNEAWSENFGFVPLSRREIAEMARDLKPVIDPSLCVFAEVEGEPVGAALLLPDVNEALRPLRGRLFPLGWWKLATRLRRVQRVRGLVLGVRAGYRKLGIDYALFLDATHATLARGARRIEISWMLADNADILRPLERFGCKVTKRYRLYEKPLPAPPTG